MRMRRLTCSRTFRERRDGQQHLARWDDEAASDGMGQRDFYRQGEPGR